ncbi:MAG TPA: SDR family oxidoreductase [Gammaproteobacteria bacterium]|jgi:NAD(P)-dependent dehydrogenase (short-subunit alcohol dehydrogenase family)|nr:SDR family oxidoreductase [Gammaproteobacteria bacterium]
MDLRLKGRAALVTGASKGIGKAIARGLAEEGVNLALLARSAEPLRAAAAEIAAATGVEVLAVPTDIRDDAAVAAAVGAAAQRFGRIHILVNNAGGPIKRPERQITWPSADWADDIDTKTLGMLRITKALLPHMPADGTGRIVNISGIAGSSVLTSALTHGLNNAAMNHVTSYLAADLAAARITVNCVIPGLIATEWREGWAERSAGQRHTGKPEFLEQICREWGIVAGRWGTMEEVADAVVFLASDRAAYINGAKLTVDGGYAINVRG